jgi:hydroxymethylpyrimidine pyrophosphatase-like HAD family hydrolase
MEALARCRLAVKPDFVVVVEREIYQHQDSSYSEVEDWNQECRQAHQELFEAVTPDLPEIIEWVGRSFKATTYEDSYSPFCLVAESNEEADGICAGLREYCESIPHLSLVRNDVYARLSHDSFNKGTSLARIARQLNAPVESVLAAGDHYNDLPMLQRKFAARLAAPENAISAVKDQVRREGGYVSSLSQGHGVADAIHFYLGHPSSPEIVKEEI